MCWACGGLVKRLKPVDDVTLGRIWRFDWLGYCSRRRRHGRAHHESLREVIAIHGASRQEALDYLHLVGSQDVPLLLRLDTFRYQA